MTTIIIFDTTLRDGEQSPGASMNKAEKLTVARQLQRLNVDVIEAGFPMSSPDDYDAVRLIAAEVRGPVIAGLARARLEDVDRCWEALRPAERGRIHVFLSTSEVHMRHQLKMSREHVLDAAVRSVQRAKRYTDDVEFSPMDATRSNLGFLCRVVEAVIRAGATTVNIPDTVGYAVPFEFGGMIKTMMDKVPNIHRAVVSVHCHNDLGLAVANSLAAVTQGARQVECTINGIGERAGNASLEEIVMTLRVRKPLFRADTRVEASELQKTSRLVSSITGIVVQPNKAIVGANAFAHESGVHQHGLLMDKRTYAIMTPKSVGFTHHRLVLGKHSGRHAFRKRLEELGHHLKPEDLDRAFERFKRLADQKKEVFDEDIEAILAEEITRITETYVLRSLHVESGTATTPTATIELGINGRTLRRTGQGDGPVDATYRMISALTETKSRLLTYSVKAITGGTDALGEVTVRVEEAGRTVIGQGADTDIIVASAKAYLNALNKLAYWKTRGT